MSWTDDGVMECADLVIADRNTSSSLDFIEIIGSNSKGLGVGLTVSVVPPASLGGTYTCNGDAGLAVIFTYTTNTSTNNPQMTCTITLTNPGAPGGANATGTFSATVSPPTGGTKTITNGTFDVPVMFLGG